MGFFDNNLDKAVDWMRARGVSKLYFSGSDITGVELFPPHDTEPAPAPDELPEAEAYIPPQGKCAVIGCDGDSGWMGSPYCREHGLSAAGVKR